MDYAQSMLHSEVLRIAAARCWIHLTTDFRWRHRFLKLADNLNADCLSGIVEADQTLFRESFKGRRDIIGRAVRKRSNANPDEAKWVPVLVARDCSDDEAGFVLDRYTLNNVEHYLLPRLAPDIVLCTDVHLTFGALAAKHRMAHEVLNASAGERLGVPAFHIQGVNNYHRRLKGWIERFHGVAIRYLHHYLARCAWFRWFDRHRTSIRQSFDFMSDSCKWRKVNIYPEHSPLLCIGNQPFE